MPMSWTPENDRLLLLKLIETHGISVDSNKIVAAWTEGPVKPTARAVTERFVKLRQLAGIKASISTGTPGRARPCQSKYTTPKKRKTKVDSDESDADDQVTEEDIDESPSKRSAQRTGGRGRGGRGGRGAAISSPDVHIKAEHPPPEFLGDTLDDSDDFEREAAHAVDLRQAAEDDPYNFDAIAAGGMNGGRQAFGVPVGHRVSTGFGLQDPFASPFLLDHGINHGVSAASTGRANGHANANPASARAARRSAAPRDSPSRNRSIRKASAQASEGVGTFLRRQKDEDEADGEKTSDDDSQTSEYHDLDGDYI